MTVRYCLITTLCLLTAWLGIFVLEEAFELSGTLLFWRKRGDLNVQIRDGLAQVSVRKIDPKVKATVEAALDGGVVASDWRQLMLVSQCYLLAITAACITAAASLVEINVPITFLAMAIPVAGLLLVQLPFMIGQQRVRSMLLGQHRGVAREELRERVAKLVPLVPPLYSWLGLIVSTGFGALLIKLLEELARHSP